MPAEGAPLGPQDKGPEARNLHIFAASHRIAHQVQDPLHHCGGFSPGQADFPMHHLAQISACQRIAFRHCLPPPTSPHVTNSLENLSSTYPISCVLWISAGFLSEDTPS